MLSICEINEEMLPKLYESYKSVGVLSTDVALELGIKQKVEVAAGASDNAAAAIGTGITAGASCNISLETSGTSVVQPQDYAGRAAVGIIGDFVSTAKHGAVNLVSSPRSLCITPRLGWVPTLLP